MWGSMLDDLTNHSQPKRVFSLRSRWYPSDMIRCLPARLVLMRRNLICYCASAGYGNQEISCLPLGPCKCPLTTGSGRQAGPLGSLFPGTDWAAGRAYTSRPPPPLSI